MKNLSAERLYQEYVFVLEEYTSFIIKLTHLIDKAQDDDERVSNQDLLDAITSTLAPLRSRADALRKEMHAESQ